MCDQWHLTRPIKQLHSQGTLKIENSAKLGRNQRKLRWRPKRHSHRKKGLDRSNVSGHRSQKMTENVAFSAFLTSAFLWRQCQKIESVLFTLDMFKAYPLIGMIMSFWINGGGPSLEICRVNLARDFQLLDVDVWCIQETRFSTCDREYILSGRFFSLPSSTLKRCFLATEQVFERSVCLVFADPVDRLCMLDVAIKDKSLRLIVAYAPLIIRSGLIYYSGSSRFWRRLFG